MNSSNHKTCIITLDGPAGAGKSTVSRALAAKMGFNYIDTGAMYRCIALKAIRESVDVKDENAVIRLTEQAEVKLDYQAGTLKVALDEEDVSDQIRTQEVSEKASAVAKIAGVRKILVGWQRKMGEEQDVVIEGRDAGTVVFPHATFKFYLDADVAERTRRRMIDLKAAGKEMDLKELQKTIEARDKNDSTRKASPLKAADDAIVIDSTDLSIDGTADVILKIIHDTK